MTHELKILPLYFEAVALREKTFEIRVNDRDYHVGDTLVLKEWENGDYTGRAISRYVNYIYYGDGSFGIPDGIVIMNLKLSGAKATLDTPQTETKTETQISNLTFEKADERCKGCNHYKLTCDLFSEICKYEPKDKPKEIFTVTTSPCIVKAKQTEPIPKDVVVPCGNGNVLMNEDTYDELIEQAAQQTEPQSGYCNECKWCGDKQVCGRCRSRNLYASKDKPQIDNFFRNPTAEEMKAIREYIDSISIPTGVNVFDLMDELKTEGDE